MICGVPTKQIALSLAFDKNSANNPAVRPGNFLYNTQCPKATGPGFDSDWHGELGDLEVEWDW
jgi:hypothetical protein